MADSFFRDIVDALRSTPGVSVVEEDPDLGAARLACDDLESKLAACNAIATVGAQHAEIQTVAGALNELASSPDDFVDRVTDFVTRTCTWTDEPGETFRAPWVTLRQGKADCDCTAILAVSIAIAGGVPASVVAVPTSGGDYHAIALYELPSGPRWGETTVKGYPPGKDPRELIRELAARDHGDDTMGRLGETRPFPVGGGLKFTFTPITRAHDPGFARELEPSSVAPPAPPASSGPNWPVIGAVVAGGTAAGAGAGALVGGKGKRAKGSLIGGAIGGVLSALASTVAYKLGAAT